MSTSKKNKIAIVIKSSIDLDSRVLSQIDSLSVNFRNNKICVFYLPDSPRKSKFKKNVIFKNIFLLTRKLPKSKFWQFFKLLEYCIVIFFKLKIFKPTIIHVHDENSIIGPLLYKFFNKSVKLIYDDHELKNLPPKNLIENLMYFLEKKIYSNADLVITTNNSRRKIAKSLFKPKKIYIIENWVYERGIKNLENHTIKLLNRIKKIKAEGKKIILHQGDLTIERGVLVIKKIMKQLNNDWVIFFIGTKKHKFDYYFKNAENIYYGDFVSNKDLKFIWEKMDSVIIFYDNSSLNNKYCAPNRLFLALNLGIPVIVNSDNPELQMLLNKYKIGISVSDYIQSKDLEKFFLKNDYYKNIALTYLRNFEYTTKNHPIINIYKSID